MITLTRKQVEKILEAMKMRGHTEVTVLGSEMWTRKDRHDAYLERI